MADRKKNSGIEITPNFIDFRFDNYWLIIRIFTKKILEIRKFAKSNEWYRVKWEFDKLEK
jgi:hypothetical protein